MLSSPPIMALAPPPTSLVAPWTPLFCSNSDFSCYRTASNVSFNQTPRALGRFSVSFPPRVQRSKSISRSLFGDQLQHLCLSSFSSCGKTNYVNDHHDRNSRFLSLAHGESCYDDGSHIRKIEEEEKLVASSVLPKEEKVALEKLSYLKLAMGLGFGGQLLCTHLAISIANYVRLYTDFMTSPTESLIFKGLYICTSISAGSALDRYLFVAQQHGNMVNSNSKSSAWWHEGKTLTTYFNDGLVWNVLGICLAIMTIRSSAYTFMRSQEFGLYNFFKIISKSYAPGSLVVASEVWPLQASIFFLLSNILGLACSSWCYNRRDQNQSEAMSKILGRAGLVALKCIAVDIVVRLYFAARDDGLSQFILRFMRR